MKTYGTGEALDVQRCCRHRRNWCDGGSRNRNTLLLRANPMMSGTLVTKLGYGVFAALVMEHRHLLTKRSCCVSVLLEV